MYMITGSGSTAIRQRFSYVAAGNLVAVVYKVGSGTSYIYYYLRNAQGDVVKMIDSSGNTVVEYTYDSWGRIIATTGNLANTVGANHPFRYRGYVYDEETGWYYLQSRYYDPTTCRFISADVLLSTGQGVIGHNAFAYCGNNPIIRGDDEGDFWHIVIGAAIGAVLGFASNVATQLIEGNSLSDVNLASAIASAAFGAAEGALMAACPAYGVFIGAGAGVGESIVTGVIEEKSIGEIAVDAIVSGSLGAITGSWGSGLAQNKDVINEGVKNLGKKIIKGTKKLPAKAAKALNKSIGKMFKVVGKEFTSSIVEKTTIWGLTQLSTRRIKAAFRIRQNY